jgi:alkylation response protein AidB-like acyl-CoA dehydrogenase
MTQPSLALLDHEIALRDTARAFVEKHCPVGDVRLLRDNEALPGYRPELWTSITALDWVGLTLPVGQGGAGGTLADAGIVNEELGRHLVSTPLRAVYEVLPILAAGESSACRKIIDGVLGGELLCILASDARAPTSLAPMIAQVDGATYRLDGGTQVVPFAAQADVIIVPAVISASGDDTGVGLFAVERDGPGITTVVSRLIDGQPRGQVTLDEVTVPASALIAQPNSAVRLLEEAWELGAILAASESLGAARAALELTRSHLRTREQFGVPIGTFQALQHRAARMHVAVELAESAVRAALRECDQVGPREARVAISVAKAMTNDAFSLVAREGIQMHGGMGMTDEADIGLYLKRMMVACTEFGDTRMHARRVAEHALDLPIFTDSI